MLPALGNELHQGIRSEVLRGFVPFGVVDSLQILKLAPGSKAPVWESVSPSAIHAREQGCP